MHPIDGRTLPGVPSADQSRVRRWARAIADRTTLQPWFNAGTGGVHFCMGTPSVASTSERILRRDGYVSLPSEDEVCRRVYAAREPMRRKLDRIRDTERENERRRERAIVVEQEAMRSDRRHAAKRHIEKLEIGRRYRPFVTVNK